MDIDECAQTPPICDLLTVCSNLPGRFTCTACPAGYRGDGVSGCKLQTTCAVNNGGCDQLQVSKAASAAAEMSLSP